MLALKLLLTPTLIGLVSLVGRRWGPGVSGWLVGLPLTSGPVALFLALDYGTLFASRAAQGTLIGQGSVACFCLAYSWLTVRCSWFYCLVVSWGAFFASTFLLEWVSVPLGFAFGGVLLFLCLVLKLMPNSKGQTVVKSAPSWEILLRMLVATTFVLVLTGVAGIVGPHLSGLLTPFPIYGTILAAFTHHFQGASAARRLLRGLVIGSFTFTAFFLVLAVLLERWSLFATFGMAVLVALGVHSCSLLLMRRFAVEQR